KSRGYVMPPFVRGRIFPEVESTGRAKSCLDVLLWLSKINTAELTALDMIEILRDYLSSITPIPCSINIWLPAAFAAAAKVLTALRIKFRFVETAKTTEKVKAGLPG